MQVTSNWSATNQQQVARLGPKPLADLGQQRRASKFLAVGEASLPSGLDLEPDESLGAEVLDEQGGQFVDALARVAIGRRPWR